MFEICHLYALYFLKIVFDRSKKNLIKISFSSNTLMEKLQYYIFREIHVQRQKA